jgi:hypothetical protein
MSAPVAPLSCAWEADGWVDGGSYSPTPTTRRDRRDRVGLPGAGPGRPPVPSHRATDHLPDKPGSTLVTRPAWEDEDFPSQILKLQALVGNHVVTTMLRRDIEQGSWTGGGVWRRPGPAVRFNGGDMDGGFYVHSAWPEP